MPVLVGKNEIALHTNYSKLLSLAQLLGCDYFLKLKVNTRANITDLNSGYSVGYSVGYTLCQRRSLNQA